MNSEKFIENKRAYELYVKTPLLKALLKIIIPGVLISIMMSVYWFFDQLMLASLVPNDGVHIFSKIFPFIQMSESEFKDLVESKGLVFYGSGEIIKSALTISSPITVVLISLPFFISTGSCVIFTQAIGKNNENKANEILKAGFWMSFVVGAILAVVLTSCGKSLLTQMAGDRVHCDDQLLDRYYTVVHEKQIEYAHSFIIYMSAGSILPCFINYFSGLVRAEGRLLLPTLFAIGCNIVNVVLDAILITCAKFGMASGGIATLSGWTINLISLIVYIAYLNNKKQFTWIRFRKFMLFNKVKFNYRLISPVLLLGLSGFLIDFTYSIAMMFYLPILSQTSFDVGVAGGGEYFMTISGAVVPIMNLFFSSIWGIVDGGRPINAYNYSISNFKRIKKTYFEIIMIGLVFSVFCLAFVSSIGKPLLIAFQVKKEMMVDAYQYLLIDMLMIPVFSFQLSAILLYQGTNNILRANVGSIFQDVIVYYPTLLIMRSVCLSCGNIWALIPTYLISALVSSLIITTYTCWFLSKRFGKIKIKMIVNNRKKTLWVPSSILKMSLAEKALSY